jgi:environmental stress-induced protein Ves
VSAAEAIDWRELAPQPWKNGAGLTRELAVRPSGACASEFDWRISVAEVAHDAPFSAFPGVDRCIVLLGGAGMTLRDTHGAWQHRLDQPLRPFSFPGDADVDARLIGGASHDLNVMTRRGRWRSEVSVVHAAHVAAPADAGLVLCCEGAWQVEGIAATLEPSRALLWCESMPAVQLGPERDNGSLIVVRLLCQDLAA